MSALQIVYIVHHTSVNNEFHNSRLKYIFKGVNAFQWNTEAS